MPHKPSSSRADFRGDWYYRHILLLKSSGLSHVVSWKFSLIISYQGHLSRKNKSLYIYLYIRQFRNFGGNNIQKSTVSNHTWG